MRFKLAVNSDDELTATSGAFNNAYSYNTNGEQTGRTVGGVAHTLTYDNEGQLTQISSTGGTTSFAYDALGRRVERTAGSTTTKYVRAGDVNGGQVLMEKQGSTVTASYTYGNGLIAKGSDIFLYDGLGSTRQTTNSTGSVTSSATYAAFGNAISGSGLGYGFAATSGYKSDGDAGLMHVGARYYDAQVGRFVTRDSYLDQKPYTYCEADPINAVDPSGHDALGINEVVGGPIMTVGMVMIAIGVLMFLNGFVTALKPGSNLAGTLMMVGGMITVCLGWFVFLMGQNISYNRHPHAGMPFH